MRLNTYKFYLIGGLAVLANSACATPIGEPRTAAAVIAADKAWGRMEVDGDVAALEALLLDRYQTVDAQGRAIQKPALIEAARKRHGRSESLAKAVVDWKASHPTRPEVSIVGNIAVLTWIMKDAAGLEHVSSCDIFMYIKGRWRAAYSQHSNASL